MIYILMILSILSLLFIIGAAIYTIVVSKKIEKKRGKWLFDGDCLICAYCGHAIDYHPKIALGGGYIIPKVCPKCQNEKTKLGIA